MFSLSLFTTFKKIELLGVLLESVCIKPYLDLYFVTYIPTLSANS